MEFHDIILVMLAAVVCSFCGFYYLSKSPKRHTSKNPEKKDEISLLFKGDKLHHATENALKIVHFKSGENDWKTLHRSLASRFPDFPVAPIKPNNTLVIKASSDDDVAKLEIRSTDGYTHIQIVDREILASDLQHKIRALESLVRTAGLAGATSPNPIWKVDHSGEISWYNTAYEELHMLATDAAVDIRKPLFSLDETNELPHSINRLPLKIASEERPLWFDVSVSNIMDGKMYFATNMTEVITSKANEKYLIESLINTFEQLSTGIALFDANKRLLQFNTELTRLTNLTSKFLSSHPDLSSFLDKLRNERIIPEPKNYQNWRQKTIADISSGEYQETWTLDTGHTFYACGHVHHNGTVAFLLDDISSQVSMTQNFRSNLEIHQSLLDSFDSALVIFSSTGVLRTSNAIYRYMWKHDSESLRSDFTIENAIKDWKASTFANPFWDDIRDFVLKVGKREEWKCDIIKTNGQKINCIVKPIALGATLIQFDTTPEQNANSTKKYHSMVN